MTTAAPPRWATTPREPLDPAVVQRMRTLALLAPRRAGAVPHPN